MKFENVPFFAIGIFIGFVCWLMYTNHQQGEALKDALKPPVIPVCVKYTSVINGEKIVYDKVDNNETGVFNGKYYLKINKIDISLDPANTSVKQVAC